MEMTKFYAFRVEMTKVYVLATRRLENQPETEKMAGEHGIKRL